MHPIQARSPPTYPEHEQALRVVGLPFVDQMGFFLVVEEIYEILNNSENLKIPLPVHALMRGNQPRMSLRSDDKLIYKFLLHVLQDIQQSALMDVSIYRLRQLYDRLHILVGVQATSCCLSQLVRDSCKFIVNMKRWPPHIYTAHYTPLPDPWQCARGESSEAKAE